MLAFIECQLKTKSTKVVALRLISLIASTNPAQILKLSMIEEIGKNFISVLKISKVIPTHLIETSFILLLNRLNVVMFSDTPSN